MGRAHFVKLLASGGAAGTKIDILGTNLTGGTSVTFQWDRCYVHCSFGFVNYCNRAYRSNQRHG